MDAELSLSHAELDAMADDIAETAAHLDAATHRLLALIREFDRARGWHQQGALSCAQWLSWRLGLGLGPAREKVRVAHRLAELPLIDEALRRGELSFCKVRALTRVATPANEAELLAQARLTTGAQLERICRLYRYKRHIVILGRPDLIVPRGPIPPPRLECSPRGHIRPNESRSLGPRPPPFACG